MQNFCLILKYFAFLLWIENKAFQFLLLYRYVRPVLITNCPIMFFQKPLNQGLIFAVIFWLLANSPHNGGLLSINLPWMSLSVLIEKVIKWYSQDPLCPNMFPVSKIRKRTVKKFFFQPSISFRYLKKKYT